MLTSRNSSKFAEQYCKQAYKLEGDEDIAKDIASTHITPASNISTKEPMTQARARRLGQQVNSFLGLINYLIMEQMILSNDCCLLVSTCERTDGEVLIKPDQLRRPVPVMTSSSDQSLCRQLLIKPVPVSTSSANQSP